MLDSNHKGYLTKDDLLVGFNMIYGHDNEEILEKTRQLVDKVFSKCDLDNSNSLEYREWMIATINKETLLTDKILFQAFQAIDDDDSNAISMDEFRDVLFRDNEID